MSSRDVNPLLLCYCTAGHLSTQNVSLVARRVHMLSLSERMSECMDVEERLVVVMLTKLKCVQAAAATTNAFLISSLRYIRASAIRAAQVGAHPWFDLNCLHPNCQMIHLAFAITSAAMERQQVSGRFS